MDASDLQGGFPDDGVGVLLFPPFGGFRPRLAGDGEEEGGADAAFDVRAAGVGVNYGLNKVRFTAPVPVGSRVRGRMTLLSAEPIAGQGLQMTWQVQVEREGVEKPVCVAESLVRRYP